jgi:hypothetical protein
MVPVIPTEREVQVCPENGKGKFLRVMWGLVSAEPKSASQENETFCTR